MLQNNQPYISAQKLAYKGVVFDVVQRQIETESGLIQRDVVTKKPVVVCMVRHRTNDELILVQEYRAGVNQVELGFVAGIVDKGETPMQAAIRETKEETGYAPMSIDYLGETNTSAGFTDEVVYHFYVEVDGDQSEQSLDFDEDIKVVNAPFSNFIKLFENGDIKGNHAHATVLKGMLEGIFKLDQ